MKFKVLLERLSAPTAQKNRTRFDMFLSFGCLILSLGILLSSTTYSWIRRNWSSTIQEDQLKIQSDGSLAFQLDENNSEYTNSISLLQQIGRTDFTLKPVSNATGNSYDFFTLNKETANAETYAHILLGATAKDRMETGIANGYVEFSFKILGDRVIAGEASTTKFVFLNSNSFFKAYDDEATTDPTNALRISITAGDVKQSDTSNKTILIKKKLDSEADNTHYGINNVQDADGNWIADHAQYWETAGTVTATKLIKNGVQVPNIVDGMEEGYPVTVSQVVGELSDYDGGITEEANGDRYIDQNACICQFSSSDSLDITVRIWIEGTDPYCTDIIAGMQISLLLSFTAANCEKQADGRYKIVEKTTN